MTVVVSIDTLSLSDPLLQHYRERGITELYPPQAAAVNAGLLEGRSLVASIPTGAGKTLLAELAMIAADGPALYIVPLRALAREKGETFRKLPDTTVAVATGDPTSTDVQLDEADIIVATSEKVDALIRAGASAVNTVGCVVVDEVHLVDQADRGPTLEMVIAKLRRARPQLQLLALSATIANPEAIATWLDAETVVSEWRPVELRRGIHHEQTVTFDTGPSKTVRVGDEETPTTALIRSGLADGGQVLVFVHSRRAAVTLAEEVATKEWTPTTKETARTIKDTAHSEIGHDLATTVNNGVAFHHAGLRQAHRSLVESAFRERSLQVVIATPTLAAGVNLPARRVIVRDTERYTDSGWTPLPVLEVHQMFGRAGRPGLDPHGEAILVADEASTAEELHDRYIDTDPEAIASSLATQDALRTHVLGTVASGAASTREDLVSVLEGTFYAVEADPTTLVDVADLVLDYLVAEELLTRENEELSATPLGQTVSRQYLDPLAAVTFREGLEHFEDLRTVSRLTILAEVCQAQEVPTPYLSDDAHGNAHRFVAEHQPELRSNRSGTYSEWLETIQAVRILAARLDGASEATVTDQYDVAPGDLRSTTEQATWIAGAFAAIADELESQYADQIAAIHDGLADLGNREASSPINQSQSGEDTAP